MRSEVAKLRPDKRRRYGVELRRRILDWVSSAGSFDHFALKPLDVNGRKKLVSAAEARFAAPFSVITDLLHRKPGYHRHMPHVKKSKTQGMSFPFLGQGDASYYEWFELWVWFAAPVPKSARAALLAGGPPPAIADVEWPAPDVLWASNGDQWIQRHLREAYGRSSAEKKFNVAIETWLGAMHARHPLLFAVRREDAEAGGTRLGAWHATSVDPFVDDVAPRLVKALAKTKLDRSDLRRTPITLAANFVGPSRVRALKMHTNANALVDDSAAAAAIEAEANARREMSMAFRERKFPAASKWAAKQQSPDGAFRALSSLTDDVFCMGVDLSVAGAHRLVVGMIERGFAGKPLSAMRKRFVEQQKSMSIHQVSVAYAGALQAASWADDLKAFDAVKRLIDEPSEALRSYCSRSAVAVEAKRPAFAKKLRAIAI